MPIVDRRLTLPALALALGSAALHAAWNLLLARAQGHPGGDRGDLRALGRDRRAVRPDLVERRAVGVAVRARLDAARDGLRDRARVRLPDGRAVVRLPADPRARAGARARAARSRSSGTRPRRPRSAACCSSRRASCSSAGRRATATRGRSLVGDDDRRHDRRLHARRPRRDPARRRAHLLRARPRRAVPRLPAARGDAGDAARARPAPCSPPRSANVGSFVLGLLALRRGAAAPVLAVRSSSIVIATLLAGRVLAEHVSRRRLAGSLLVFAGVAARLAL